MLLVGGERTVSFVEVGARAVTLVVVVDDEGGVGGGEMEEDGGIGNGMSGVISGAGGDAIAGE